MAITYTAAIQNRIAYKVWGVANSSLSPDQKALLDGTWTTGSLTTGVAYDAITRVNQYAQWFNLAGAADAPAAWEQWFVAEAALLAVQTVRPERVGLFERERDNAIDAALDAFSVLDANGSTLGLQTLDYKNIRFYVMNHCVRRKFAYAKDGEKYRLFVPPSNVDAATTWVLNYIWNYAKWRFRKRQISIRIVPITFSAGTWTESTKTLASIDTSTYTLAAGSPIYITGGTGVVTGEYRIASKPGDTSLTLDSSLSSAGTNLSTGDISGVFYQVTARGLGSGESLDSLSSRELYYLAESNSERGSLSWVTADEMAELRANYQGNTDRPAWLRLERRAASLVWLLCPYPDATYNLTGEAFVSSPAAASDSADTAPFMSFPAEFRTVIREMVLAKVLINHNAPGGFELWQRCVDQVSGLLNEYEDHGSVEADSSERTRDVYEDMGALGDPARLGGGM